MSALRDSTTPSLVENTRMVRDARTISDIHDYIAVMAASLEIHPDNPIMIQQHAHWTMYVRKASERFRKKWGRYPVSVVEETL